MGRKLRLACLLSSLSAAVTLLFACVGDDAPAPAVTPGADTGAPDSPLGTDAPVADTSTPEDAAQDRDAAPTPPRFLAIDAANQLVKFSKSAPEAIDTVKLSGLVGGDTIVGIDVRPKDGTLYGVGSGGRLYRINRANGNVLQIGPLFAQPLTGTGFGIDFVPAIDRIRVVSNTGQNFRLNPDDGSFIGPDVALTYAPADPNAGSTPSGDGLATIPTTPDAGVPGSFVIDGAKRTLAAFESGPNNGVLVTIGNLGLAGGVVSQVGFDVLEENGKAVAYLVANPGGAPSSTLYQVNLQTGAATALGPVGGAPLRALSHEL